jgi:hypothetical protein
MPEDQPKLTSWVTSLKVGALAALCFIVACFIYGWFNDFIFWHAFANAGLNSSIAHALYYGVFAGPIVLVLVTFLMRFMVKK